MVEWVPASDPMFVSLMRGRTELYAGIGEEDFLPRAGLFRVVRQTWRWAMGVILILLELEHGGE